MGRAHDPCSPDRERYRERHREGELSRGRAAVSHQLAQSLSPSGHNWPAGMPWPRGAQGTVGRSGRTSNATRARSSSFSKFGAFRVLLVRYPGTRVGVPGTPRPGQLQGSRATPTRSAARRSSGGRAAARRGLVSPKCAESSEIIDSQLVLNWVANPYYGRKPCMGSTITSDKPFALYWCSRSSIYYEYMVQRAGHVSPRPLFFPAARHSAPRRAARAKLIASHARPDRGGRGDAVRL